MMDIGIIYDFDGTLISTTNRFIIPILNPLYNYVEEIPDRIIDKALNDLIDALSKKTKVQILKILWNLGKDLKLSHIKRINFLQKAFSNFKKARHTYEPLENFHTSLAISQKYGKVAIVTSATRAELEIAKTIIPALQSITTTITRNEVKNIKPHPEALLSACTLLDVEPKNSVYVGDLPSDITAAHNAGMMSIAFLGEYQKYTKKILEATHPNFIVQDHRDLNKLLQYLLIDLKQRQKMTILT